MSIEAPKIDPRTATEVEAQVRALIKQYLPDWNGSDSDPLASSLIAIFGRYSEIIIQRLNEVPRKNFLAFLDLLGASLQPPQPARVPLTFSLAAGSAADGVVLAGTQVAAPPGEGETDPVIYETERELVVTAAQLDALFARDSAQDKFTDLSQLLSESSPDGLHLLEGKTPIDHILYIGDKDFFSLPNLSDVTLTLNFDRVVQDEMKIEWQRWDGEEGWKLIKEQKTDTNNQQQVFNFGKLDPIPLSKVADVESRWIRGLLRTPITLAQIPQANKVRASQLPKNATSAFTASVGGAVMAENSFTNQFPVDTSKEFFPLGEKPRLGDAWLIAQGEAFSQAGAKITLDLTIVSGVRTDGNPALTWEFWDGRNWQPLKVVTAEPKIGQVQDNTFRLTRTGTVVLQLPVPSAPKEINGVQGSWLRVRLTGGDYGREASYTLKTPNRPEDGYTLTPATFAPPIISSLKISYSGTKTATQEVMLAFNNFVFNKPVSVVGIPDPAARVGAQTTLKPFRSVTETVVGGETRPTLYFGFTLPSGSRFPQRTVSLYLSLVEPLFGQASGSPADRPTLAWEYWDGKLWSKLLADDDSASLTRPGLVEFLPPADFSRRMEFGLTRHWLRARWEKGEFGFKPLARRLLLNTTMARQAATLNDEILGSSDGSKNQTFRLTRTPILEGAQLEVREPELPSVAEQRALKNEEGDDAIAIIPDEAGRPREIWVRWHEVPDFYGSLPRDRHYVLDHLTGELRFGDGSNGLIPPVGRGNLRLGQYRTGGGRAGNRPADAIVQLKTTVPYVDKVTNHEAAKGGADAESLDSLLERAPRTIRHNNRAVTVEDFEDVARLASPEVARAKCVPLRDLISDPLDKNVPTDPLSRLPGLRGQISVIVVPRKTEPKPLPSLQLIERVQEYLDLHSLPTAHVHVTGPIYLRVDVEAEIALVSLEGAGAVEQAVQKSLADFLHPLSGGLDGKGWDFGRQPHLSDLYALIETVKGVDHINMLKLTESVDEADIVALGLNKITAVADIKKTERFLVYSGAHAISLKIEEE